MKVSPLPRPTTRGELLEALAMDGDTFVAAYGHHIEVRLRMALSPWVKKPSRDLWDSALAARRRSSKDDYGTAFWLRAFLLTRPEQASSNPWLLHSYGRATRGSYLDLLLAFGAPLPLPVDALAARVFDGLEWEHDLCLITSLLHTDTYDLLTPACLQQIWLCVLGGPKDRVEDLLARDLELLVWDDPVAVVDMASRSGRLLQSFTENYPAALAAHVPLPQAVDLL